MANGVHGPRAGGILRPGDGHGGGGRRANAPRAGGGPPGGGRRGQVLVVDGWAADPGRDRARRDDVHRHPEAGRAAVPEEAGGAIVRHGQGSLPVSPRAAARERSGRTPDAGPLVPEPPYDRRSHGATGEGPGAQPGPQAGPGHVDQDYPGGGHPACRREDQGQRGGADRRAARRRWPRTVRVPWIRPYCGAPSGGWGSAGHR